MPINQTFREAINRLKENQTNYYLKYESILKWCKENTDLYNKSIDNYSCSIHEPKLPCFCEKRKIDCLFIDIYQLLNKLVDKEEIFKKKILEFSLLKGNNNKLLDFRNNNDQLRFQSYINDKGITNQLNASKKDGEYLKFIIRIKKEELINHNRLNKILKEMNPTE